MVHQCEWREEHQRGRVQPNKLGSVRGVAGVGKRPVSKQHMPNFISEAGDRGDVDKAEERNEEGQDFDLGKVRERLAVVRAAEAQREQH